MKLKILAVCLVIIVLLAQSSFTGQSGQADYTCSFNSVVGNVLSRADLPSYTDWIRRLSGDLPVRISSQPAKLDTRYTPAMFLTQTANARAFEYVEQQVRRLLLDSQVAEHHFTMYYITDAFTAKNLVVELPGTTNPDEVIILSAHLDSKSETPMVYAPGADDNATGSAALLEAARLLRTARFARTIRLIWFTGEEQGLKGSYAYVNDPSVNLSRIIGVINLDMFGYDNDSDRCFELHVGELAASDVVGQCIAHSITAYGLDLSYDYLTVDATKLSDHAAFWSKEIGAVEVLENYFDNSQSGGCTGWDKNIYYHLTGDTLANMHPSYAHSITQAAIAAAAGLAGPQALCLGGLAPTLKDATVSPGAIELRWDAVANAAGYRVFRSSQACGAEVEHIADVAGLTWQDQYLSDGHTYYYWVEAVSPEGCFSLSNGCAVLEASAFTAHLPLISR